MILKGPGAMADPTTAHDVAARFRHLSIAAQIGLRGNPDDPAFLDGVRQVLDFDLPIVPNIVNASGNVRILWLGPDEWLIAADDGAAADLVGGLEASLDGHHVSIVDLSASRTVFELSGPQARSVLEKGCLLDLHPRVIAPGQCAGTIIAQTQVYLEQTDDRPTYRLYVRVSFARHFSSWLLDAMAEFNS